MISRSLCFLFNLQRDNNVSKKTTNKAGIICYIDQRIILLNYYDLLRQCYNDVSLNNEGLVLCCHNVWRCRNSS